MISTKTGTAPNWKIGLTVVGKPAATEIISSPGVMALSLCKWEVKDKKAKRFADEPELTVTKFFTFKKFANFSWNSWLNLPVVSQPSKADKIIFLVSSKPISLPDGGITVLPGINSYFCFLSNISLIFDHLIIL